MKVVVAIDSLKGSLTSLEAGNANTIYAFVPEYETVCLLLAETIFVRDSGFDTVVVKLVP